MVEKEGWWWWCEKGKRLEKGKKHKILWGTVQLVLCSAHYSSTYRAVQALQLPTILLFLVEDMGCNEPFAVESGSGSNRLELLSMDGKKSQQYQPI